jgi:hypothetical protein
MLRPARVPWFEIETLALAPVDWRGWRVVPYARALRLRLPFWPVGLVWLRPWRLESIAPDQSRRWVPVRDLTGALLLSIGALALLSLVLLWRAGRPSSVERRLEGRYAET